MPFPTRIPETAILVGQHPRAMMSEAGCFTAQSHGFPDFEASALQISLDQGEAVFIARWFAANSAKGHDDGKR
jgi:hypothetical protein